MECNSLALSPYTLYSFNMKYLIANWKAQMTFSQVTEWTQTFKELLSQDPTVTNDISITICPPFPFLQYLQWQFKDISNVSIGAQTISSVEEGKYTGEVTAKALQDIVNYSIIGHSERRTIFNEQEDNIEAQIAQCQKYSIQPILCIRDEQDTIYDGVKLIAYEPVSAIGTGKNMNPTEVVEMKNNLNLPNDSIFIYGGSADEKNCKEYIQTGEIQGVLVGTASLDPNRFFNMAREMK